MNIVDKQKELDEVKQVIKEIKTKSIIFEIINILMYISLVLGFAIGVNYLSAPILLILTFIIYIPLKNLSYHYFGSRMVRLFKISNLNYQQKCLENEIKLLLTKKNNYDNIQNKTIPGEVNNFDDIVNVKEKVYKLVKHK